MGCTDDCHRPTPAQAHCGSCHRTFGGVSGFDRHRRDGCCLDPERFGFAEVGRVWRLPMSESGRSRFTRLQQSAEQADQVSQGAPADSEPVNG